MANPVPAAFGMADVRPSRPIAPRAAGAPPGAARCALCGAGALMLLFAGCWLAAAAEAAGHGHLYRTMFMAGAAGPVGSLAIGVLGSGLLGLAVGALARACRAPAP